LFLLEDPEKIAHLATKMTVEDGPACIASEYKFLDIQWCDKLGKDGQFFMYVNILDIH